jgi:hypothetical protein
MVPNALDAKIHYLPDALAVHVLWSELEYQCLITWGRFTVTSRMLTLLARCCHNTADERANTSEIVLHRVNS